MSTVEFRSPDEAAPPQQFTADEAARLILDSDFEYWQQGGNGEGVFWLVDGCNQLCVKQTLQDGFLLTMLTSDDQRSPYSGDGFDEFVWDERGGEPFKVPRAFLVSAKSAAEIVRDFAASGGESGSVAWMSWYDLPQPYFPE